MKRLWARLVLCLIEPALERKAQIESVKAEELGRMFANWVPMQPLGEEQQRMRTTVDSRLMEGPGWTISDDGAFAFRKLTDEEIRRSGAKPLPNRKIIEKPREQGPEKGIGGAAAADPQA